MNCRYFACADCKQYIDAGYRWAYWLLEHPGVVQLGQQVSPEAVLAVTGYWQPSPEERSPSLVEQVLPAVRGFLAEHATHRLLYLEEDHFQREDTAHDGYTEVSSSRYA